ncbi:hypothetical protein K469DRAFT_306179 [Zopfia rhizophila CBS 207.26]|uniref:Uncharacterized protein n=1 Tax=Zopfia rhizophila CBS 207.26 TaxID=1314779 RepID=A0A6A6EKI8_9PEZI|nr:hypothetical protein K469DRAFT_306179 [Zopfia rhizophila CBS 207.26]
MASQSPRLPCFNPRHKTPPPTPPESVKSFSSTTVVDEEAPSVVLRSFSCQSRPISPIEFLLDWTLKILGVVSAILFGIWAPVSYRATTNGNLSNDEAQDQVIARLEYIAQEMQDLKKRMNSFGGLRAWEFCEAEGRRTLSACQSLASSMPIDSLLSDLANTQQTHAPSSRRTAAPTATTGSIVPSAALTISPSTISLPTSELLQRSTTFISKPTGQMNLIPTPTLKVPGFLYPDADIAGLGHKFAFGFVFWALLVLSIISGFRKVWGGVRRRMRR